MFVFALGESSGSCKILLENINHQSEYHTDAASLFSRLAEANVVFSSSMVDELIRLGVDPQGIVTKTSIFTSDDTQTDTNLLLSFSRQLKSEEINLRLLNHAIKHSESQQGLILQILSLIKLADFQNILSRCRKSDVIQFLV